MTLEKLIIEQEIKATPSRVWQRISTPEGIARWWRPGDIVAEVGHQFTMDMDTWGMIPCVVLIAEPERKLAYTFADFELHWEIIPKGEVTVLRLEHRGFDLNNPKHKFAFDNMGPGWKNFVLPRLADDAATD